MINRMRNLNNAIRTQHVEIDHLDLDGATSDPVTLIFGVPQGSVLGTILFTLYTDPLGDICRAHGIEFQLYANDQQVYLSFKQIKNNSEAQDACTKRLQKCVRDIKIWMNLNMLKLNGHKTEFIMFGTNQHLDKIDRIDINISGTAIQTVESVCNLGYFIDFIKNPHHINKISGGLYGLLKDVRFILLHINQDTAKILVKGLVLSKLEYCNSLLSGSAQYKLDELQRMQNMACRVVYNLRKYDRVIANMRNLQWLKICECITYKLGLLMFKINRKEALKHLRDLVTSNSAEKCKLRLANASLSSQFF